MNPWETERVRAKGYISIDKPQDFRGFGITCVIITTVCIAALWLAF